MFVYFLPSPFRMSARQLNRLAKAKGLDPLLGGSLDVESDESDELDSEEEGEEEERDFGKVPVVSASVSSCTDSELPYP